MGAKLTSACTVLRPGQPYASPTLISRSDIVPKTLVEFPLLVARRVIRTGILDLLPRGACRSHSFNADRFVLSGQSVASSGLGSFNVTALGHCGDLSFRKSRARRRGEVGPPLSVRAREVIKVVL